MHNVVLSPIDPEKLISSISERVTANILKAVAKPQQPTTEPTEDFLSIQEAAKLLHLTVPTMYSKHSRGELPGVSKRGKRLYFSKKILLAWLEAGRQKTTDEVKLDAESFLNKKGGGNG